MVVAEDSQELLDFLVYPLRFPICLWVVSHAEHRGDSQLFPEFAGELGRKLRSSIRYYFGQEAVLVEYIILEKGCSFFRHYCFLARGYDDPLG